MRKQISLFNCSRVCHLVTEGDKHFRESLCQIRDKRFQAVISSQKSIKSSKTQCICRHNPLNPRPAFVPLKDCVGFCAELFVLTCCSHRNVDGPMGEVWRVSDFEKLRDDGHRCHTGVQRKVLVSEL